MDYTGILWPHEPVKNDHVLVSSFSRSHDNGKTWNDVKTVNLIIDSDEIFTGTKSKNGPSYSSGNVVDSGYVSQYCSRFDGKRWRSLA